MAKNNIDNNNNNGNLSFVEQLDPGQSFWNTKVRCIKKWRQSYRQDYIFIDEKGHQIQACVRIELIPDFEALIKEDGVYVLRKFGVGAQGDLYPVVDLKKKINFYRCTSVTPVADFSGDPYGFHFWKFDDINTGKAAEVKTVDVVGRLAWCSDLDIWTTKAKETKRLTFDLQDLEGVVLKCTFWSDFVVEFHKYVSSNTQSNEMVIVILQHVRVKLWNENLGVQNDKFGTRIFFNEDLDEANKLRRSLIVKGGKDGTSTTLTQLSSQTNYPLRNDFLVMTPRKNVEDILETEKDKFCVVLATTTTLELEYGWYYIACRTCQFKVYSKMEFLTKASDIPEGFEDAPGETMWSPGETMWCVQCKNMATDMIPKFKVQFRVQDKTGSVSFILFDKEVMKILGISASDVRDRQLKSDDMDSFPHELDGLLYKLLAFKIKVSAYNIDNKKYVYTVKHFTDDPEIISELMENDDANEDVPEPQVGEIDTVKLSESSQCPVDSKDAASVTGGSLACEVVKDIAISPEKRSSPDPNEDNKSFVSPGVSSEANKDKSSTNKRLKKKNMKFNA